VYAVIGCDVHMIDHALLTGIRSDRRRRRVSVTPATHSRSAQTAILSEARKPRTA
jgi:hypothetical protein